ncbi:hypothetical protein BC332_32936 [Capsicum chinense]|nr:hypothetical protein BC332_32936 [Capsicum chinense]
MRSREDPTFCEYLLRIGDGKDQVKYHNKIEIPKSLLIPFTNEKESLNNLFRIIYPDLNMIMMDTPNVTSYVILTTKNDFVNDINEMFIHQFLGTAVTFIGIDEIVEPKDQTEFEDFLHTLNPTGLPPYKLVLKQNCPVILLRNLNPSEGLCNGTHLICIDFKTHFISAKNASGDFKGKHVTKKMTERLNIHAITPETPNWICKIQVVDMGRPGEGIKQKIKYLNMIFQDEQVCDGRTDGPSEQLTVHQIVHHSSAKTRTFYLDVMVKVTIRQATDDPPDRPSLGGYQKCPQEVRNTEKRKFQCMKCHESNMLTPRCQFNVIMKDDTGSVIGTISGKEGEKLLSLTTEQIYELASTEVPSEDVLTYGDNSFLQFEKAGIKETWKDAFILVVGSLRERHGYNGLKLLMDVHLLVYDIRGYATGIYSTMLVICSSSLEYLSLKLFTTEKIDQV